MNSNVFFLIAVESTISVENMDAAEMLRSNQPIVQLRSKLSEEMFGSLESSDSTQQWYYFTKSLFLFYFFKY